MYAPGVRCKRSNSVSDLFKTPHQRYPRRIRSISGRKLMNGHTGSNVINPMQPVISHAQHQYQLQRQKMQNTFEFNNGEKFTPRRLQPCLQNNGDSLSISSPVEVPPLNVHGFDNNESLISFEPELIKNIVNTTTANRSFDNEQDTRWKRRDNKEVQRIPLKIRRVEKFVEKAPQHQKLHHRRLHNFSTFFKRFKYGAKDKGTIRDIKPLLKQNPSSNDIESILSLKLFEPIDIGRNMDTDSSTKTKLMDAGLVFDKLLLEANKATLPPVLTLRNILEETTVPDLESEELTLSDLSINEEENDDSIHGDSECVSLLLDDNILSEFDCLGQLITLQSPPPRSEFRPKLSSMQHASKFYHSKADFKEFITRLYSDFENVVVFETARESSTGQCRGNEERSRHNDPSTVKFSTAVHVNRVETREEYDRCDRNFLRNRDLLLNSTEFLDSIKWEINEFKRCEMVVHRDSVQYTQLFL